LLSKAIINICLISMANMRDFGKYKLIKVQIPF